MLGRVFALAQSPLLAFRQLFCTMIRDLRSWMAPDLTYARGFPDVDAKISFGFGHVDIASAAAIVVIERHLGGGLGRSVVVLVFDGSTKAVEDTTALSISQLEERCKRADKQAQRPFDQ